MLMSSSLSVVSLVFVSSIIQRYKWQLRNKLTLSYTAPNGLGVIGGDVTNFVGLGGCLAESTHHRGYHPS